MNTFKLVILVFILFFLSNLAIAGSSRTGSLHHDPKVLIGFAKKVEKALAEKGARIAIIARVGQPRNKLPEGIRYTHTAFAVYSIITTSDGRKIPGYSIYNLYQKKEEPNVSDLIQDFPVDFFSTAHLLEAGLIIPTPELQKRLLSVLASPTYKKLHNSNYSVIANPFTLNFQNCTEHTLDVIMAAIYQTSNINTIKANEKAYFTAQTLDINPIKLLIGSTISSDVTTSDHPDSIQTTTFTSIGKFLTKFNAASEVITVRSGDKG